MDLLDLTPPQLEWKIYKGDTSKFTILVLDEEGEALDISNYTFLSKLKNSAAQLIVNLVVTKLNNAITIEVPVATTLTIANQRLYFDLQGTNNTTAEVTTFLNGTLFTEGDVTN